MHAEDRLRAVLETIDPVALHGPWSRSLGFHLLQQPPPGATGNQPRPLWSRGALLRGGRFTPLRVFETLYLACDPYTALAEARFVLHLPAGPPMITNLQPAAIITVDGVLTHVLDLAAPEILTRLGTSVAELTGEWRYTGGIGEIPPTHLLGKLVYESDRFFAIRYVSSKNLPHGLCLAVFPDRLVPGAASFLQVIDAQGYLNQRFPPA